MRVVRDGGAFGVDLEERGRGCTGGSVPLVYVAAAQDTHSCRHPRSRRGCLVELSRPFLHELDELLLIDPMLHHPPTRTVPAAKGFERVGVAAMEDWDVVLSTVEGASAEEVCEVGEGGRAWYSLLHAVRFSLSGSTPSGLRML